ncbi:hypothetical protein [Leptolyngbya sp. FACHB-261]|nr:hypothetical protein [Leptolyngbya sp. FACHB-261]
MQPRLADDRALRKRVFFLPLTSQPSQKLATRRSAAGNRAYRLTNEA